ncbi:hypothetical protein MIND_00595400 [Mycena indigotica]|uniref:DUF6534 domain-containing protein n=1 Tax=Mycena indigotica TaxID=2126181 RepID=A0A8H6SRE7_9AGAR|nr:uncharacterized protein MIND_00595400 [Mycena indigotica]KAF7303660.1 hypothetical protein MIND_00595400 [Mycena indigotica]
MAATASALNLVLGPVVAASFICVFQFGLVCMQAAHYLKTFASDALFVKFTIISLWTLLLGYVICVLQACYVAAVTDFGQPFALIYSPWGDWVALILGGVIDHCVQAFFVVQIYRATRARYLCIFLGSIVALLQVLSGILNAGLLHTRSIAISSADPLYHRLLLVLFFSDAAIDLVNAAVLCFYLRKQRESAFSQNTLKLVDQLVVFTLQTGLTTSLVSLATAISFKTAPTNFIWVLFYQAMPCSFVSALLANVNNRGSLSLEYRQKQSATYSSTSAGATNSRPHGLQIQISRSIVLARDASIAGFRKPEEMRDSQEDGEIELNKMEASSTEDLINFRNLVGSGMCLGTPICIEAVIVFPSSFQVVVFAADYMSAVSHLESSIISLTLGPILSGAWLVLFLFGVLCIQTVNYLRTFPKDVLHVKFTVLFLWTVHLAYTICICQGTYWMSVKDFGQLFALLSTPWGLTTAVILGQASILISIVDHGVQAGDLVVRQAIDYDDHSQAFFVFRVYRATRALYFCILLWILIAGLQALSLIVAVEGVRTASIAISIAHPQYHRLLLILFFADALMDLLNAGVLGFHLGRQRQIVFSRSTTAIVDQLVIYTLQTGFTTSLLAFGAAIAFKIAPTNYVWVTFFMAIPCSFINALLANINNRTKSRLSTKQSIPSTFGGHSGTRGIDSQISRNVVFAPRDNSTPHVDELNKMGDVVYDVGPRAL